MPSAKPENAELPISVEDHVEKMIAHTQLASEHAYAVAQNITPAATQGQEDGRRIAMINARDPVGSFRHHIAEAARFAARLRDLFQ